MKRSWFVEARILGLMVAWGAAAAATFLFVNGMTSPHAEAVVQFTTSPPEGVRIEGSSGVGTLVTDEMWFWTDRLTSRLSFVVSWLLIAAMAALVARQARLVGARGPGWLFVPTSTTRAMGWVLIGFGILPSLASHVQGSVLLTVLGQPDGLTPTGDLSPGWMVAGVLAIAWSRWGRSRLLQADGFLAPLPRQMA